MFNQLSDSDTGEIQEVISIIEKMNKRQKQYILAALRGAVLVSDENEKEGSEQ